MDTAIIHSITPDRYEQLSPTEAVALQKELRLQVNTDPLTTPVRLIGGADISFNKFEETVYAGIIVLKYPEMIPVSQVAVVTATKFPYISGLLAFREIPALLEAWDKLEQKPDLMVLDGQGIAHERRLGIATHFGLLTDVPSIGCAKSRLTGNYEEPGLLRFDSSPLFHKKEPVGVVLRSKARCKPLFISPGHKVTIHQSVEIIKTCVQKYRMPEPTRLAHLLVNQTRLQQALNNPPSLL